MNTLALLSVILGITAIICYFYACSVADHAAQMGKLMDQHLVQAARLLDHCDALEARNAWLEAERCQYRAMMAWSMLRLPVPRRATDEMTVEDGVP